MDRDTSNKRDTKLKAVFTPVVDEKLGHPVFRRVGTAFVNRDATLNVLLDALPINGRLHIRDFELEAVRVGAKKAEVV